MKLTFKRVEPGTYSTASGYLIDRGETMFWTAYAPTGPAGPRHVIGESATLAKAKELAQAYEDAQEVVAELPTATDHANAVMDTIVHALNHDPQALTEALAGPASQFQLSPRRPSHSLDVTDVELTQLLTMLDHGVKITRNLYQPWQVERTAALATAIDPEKLDATVRVAVDAGLADYSGRGHYTLRAAPIHLARTDDETWCGRRITNAGHDRIRYTTASVPGPKHPLCLARAAQS